MYMEYVIGPALALAIGIKFSLYKSKKVEAELESLIAQTSARIEVVEIKQSELNTRVEETSKVVEVIDKQTLQKMVTTLQPVSVAIKEIQQFVGLK